MRTIDEIYEALVSEFSARSGAVPTEGGDMTLRLRAVAAEVFSLEAQADFVLRQSFPQTAVGEYLDRHAALRGVERGTAGKAKGVLRFYLTEAAAGEVDIPAGTECMTAAGLAFQTTEGGKIGIGETECTVAAEAVEAGGAGNVAAETIVYIKLFPERVAGVVNDAKFTGGEDAESDERLRARVLASYRTLPNGANKAYYETKVLSMEGVEAVTVLPKKRGLGTVDVLFSTTAGVPTGEEVAKVQAMLDAQREICVDIAVSAAEAKEVDITIELAAKKDAAFETVCENVRQAVAAYFNGKRLSESVYRAALAALVMAVEGVENCSITAPQADIAAQAGVLPTLGTLAINEAV